MIIAGPTASGKSRLAIELASRLEGEVVNADSMQVYRGMDVGTAKPSAEEQNAIPHHLLDIVDPDEEFNAAIFSTMATSTLEDIALRDKLGFVVGGTGLYIKTLLGGLLDCPPSDPHLREELKRECEREGPGPLHEKLSKLDPDSARKIHPNDRVRIIRALEIIHLAKEPLSALKGRHDFKTRSFEPYKICLHRERCDLYRRINERSVAMIENGLVDETRGLLEKGFSSELKPMQALGYRHIVKHLQGDWDIDEAIDQIQRDTRRYAKRQLTWFRADPEMLWFQSDALNDIAIQIEAFISDQN